MIVLKGPLAVKQCKTDWEKLELYRQSGLLLMRLRKCMIKSIINL